MAGVDLATETTDPANVGRRPLRSSDTTRAMTASNGILDKECNTVPES